MTATGRLLFLLLVTGLFVQIWTEDATHATERRLARKRTVHSSAVAHRLPDRLPLPQLNVTSTSNDAPTHAASSPRLVWSIADCPCPMPDGLTAGTYRVVDTSGQVGLLEISNADLQASGRPTDFLPQALYQQNSGTSRWFLVRLETPSTAAVPVCVPPGEEPIATNNLPEVERRRFNRKFDFTGYESPAP